jgi:signal transduction histidine kinase
MIPVARSWSWTVASLLAFVVSGAPHGAITAETKRVLVLHSYGREFEPYASFLATFRVKLVQASSEPVALYDAALDAEHASGSDDPQPFLNLLRHRFADSPPDVVVTVGPPAAAYYVQNRDKLFPAKPLVIAALEARLVPKSALRPGDSVVAVHIDLAGLVNNILRLLPDTQTIAVVIGDSSIERYWLSEIRRESAQFASRVTFEWLNDLSMEQMRKRVATLPPRSAVLYLLILRDVIGVPYESGAALTSLVEVSAAPIFSVYESELGHGVVGGPYISQQKLGTLAAAATLRALSGQSAALPAIEATAFEAPVYDWRELKRWGLDSARLPVGSTIRFRPPSFWDQHRALIVTAISILVLQTALLIGLVWQRTRRRRAEGEALTLSGRLITAHEDERRWLARELHDDITQRLAGLAIDAAQLPGSGSSPTAKDPRGSIRGGLIQLSEDVHNLSYRLHPSVLDDLGLVQALKAECERVARVESLQVDVEADRLPQTVPKDVALGIYRVAQEALRNVVRHAKASTVQLSLALSDGGLLLTVTDNGSGFDPDVPAHRQSVGHASMRERMRSLGGKLDIQSTPGLGTTVVAWVPIPN